MPTGFYKRSKKQIEKAKLNLVRNFWTGKKMSDAHRAKMRENSKGMLGKYHTVKSKKKMSISRIGKKPTERTKMKMSKAREGSKSHFWQGGISCEPYSLTWTKTLKRSIRERDNYVCFICKALQEDYAFDVHHIFLLI